MNWAPTLLACVAAFGAYLTARHTRQATDHQTDAANWLSFNQQLQTRLNQVERSIGGVGGAVQEVRTQVTNGGSNLAATVGEVNRKVGNLGDDLRVMRNDMSGLGTDIRGLRDDLNALERRVAEGQQDS